MGDTRIRMKNRISTGITGCTGEGAGFTEITERTEIGSHHSITAITEQDPDFHGVHGDHRVGKESGVHTEITEHTEF